MVAWVTTLTPSDGNHAMGSLAKKSAPPEIAQPSSCCGTAYGVRSKAAVLAGLMGVGQIDATSVHFTGSHPDSGGMYS